MSAVLLTRLKETQISSSLLTSNISVVDRAEVPLRPSKPRTGLNLLLAITVGLFGGVGLAFVLEYLDTTIKDVKEVESVLRVPTLGLVPSQEALLGRRARRRRLAGEEGESGPFALVAHHEMESVLAEAFRNLRTSLLYSAPDHPPKTLMVTSLETEDGKTSLALNLAITLGQLGTGEILIVDGDLIPHVLAIADSLRHLETLIVAGPSDSADPELQEGLSMVDLDSLRVFGDSPRAPDADPLRTCLLIYTSGTTGPSKACELSMAYLIGQGRLMTRCLGIGQSDVLFCPYPLFHWDASVGTVIPALLNGATAVIAQRFSVSRFWGYVRRYGATVFDFMGATLGFLYKQDPDPDDANNPARLAWGVPMPAFKSDFEKRFDLTLVEGYGSTEGGVMAFQTPGQSYPDGSCGRALPEFRLQIVDDGDRPLPAGSVGEIVARPAREGDGHLMMTGYFGMPTANAEAFRGGWFHTGDLGRLDPAGNLFFEGRKKDAIRRRGENISAFEVEQVIESHPFVLEAAAYGVPSEHTEEDVAAAVVLRPGTALSAEQLLSYCGDRMASHMVPSFIRFLDKLPKTPTEKVAKSKLREFHTA